MPTKERPETDPECTVCGRRYSAHSGRQCLSCRCPVEHHQPANGAPDAVSESECWSGRARMAHAKQDAGLPLNETDETALRKHPVWETLTPTGYQVVG